jgi:hypothetical protein
MRKKQTARSEYFEPIQTRRDAGRYYGGRTIQCLLCGKRFGRLAFHLAAKHGISSDEYRIKFGLPWTRGLTSAASHANSGWTKKRRAEASKAAKRRRIFDLAHRSQNRREPPGFIRTEAVNNLGKHAAGLGPRFDKRVRALFRKGLTDAAIASVLGANRMTVNQRTKRWRK